MKTTHVYQDVEYTFSNEGLKVGDETFPISNGVAKDGVYTHEKFDFRDFMTGFPDEPHIIKDLHHNDKYKPYQVHTNCGYGPVEIYFKIIDKKPLKLNNMLEFVEKDKYLSIAGKIRKQLRDYLEKSGLKSLVIGISGGIDSAVVVALAKPVCDELGVNLIGRSITIKTNSKDEIYRAYAIGNSFCTNFEEIDLGNYYDFMIGIDNDDTVGLIRKNIDDNSTRIRSGNVKARMRMMYLYNLASKYKGMVISTDNYTEYLLGFWTQHGDVGDYSPIQELWKTEVYELAEWLAMESTDINKQLAMKLCIAAMATDGLGVTNKGDLGQILPSWEGSSRDGYKIVDEVLINYLNGEAVEPEHQIILDRNRNSEFKRLTPIFIKRDTII